MKKTAIGITLAISLSLTLVLWYNNKEAKARDFDCAVLAFLQAQCLIYKDKHHSLPLKPFLVLDEKAVCGDTEAYSNYIKVKKLSNLKCMKFIVCSKGDLIKIYSVDIEDVNTCMFHVRGQ
jgi:hypothetical protein